MNNTQEYKIIYSTSQVQPFRFKKIKSLANAHYSSFVSPNLSIINAPRCISSNFNITFANVPYVNPFENPALTYGTVNNYEYRLPANWSLGVRYLTVLLG